MNRGDRREAGFLGDADRELLVETSAEARGRTGWLARAPCLLSSHLHPVVEAVRLAGWPEAAAAERLIPPPPHTRVIENINRRRQVIKRRARGFRDAEHAEGGIMTALAPNTANFFSKKNT